MLARSVSRKRKLSIQAFEATPELPKGFVERTIERLQGAVDAIFEGRVIAWSIEELYAQVETLCNHKKAEDLYKGVSSKLEEYIGSAVEKLAENSDSDGFLELVRELWIGFGKQVETFCSIFLYLDRSYVLQSTTVRSLRGLALQIMRRQLSSSASLKGALFSKTLELVARDRGGHGIDRTLAKTIFEMLEELGLYGPGFEKAVLVASAKFFTEESSRRLDELRIMEYLTYVERRLAEEQVYFVSQKRSGFVNFVE